MTRKIKFMALLLVSGSAALMSAGQASAETKIMPLFNASLGFGNAFYLENSGTPSISYDIDYVPAVIFNEKLTLLPRLNSNYSGTMMPKEIEEEGNIYVQTWDNLLYTKIVDKLNTSWILRGELGFKSELARETADESWGSGLYDYGKTHLEVSMEKKFEKPISITFGERIYSTTFPNYRALSADSTQYSQLLSGDKVLDTASGETFIKMEWLLNRTFLACKLGATQSNYGDQKVVSIVDGHYLDTKRKDAYSNFTVGVSQLIPDFKVPLGADDEGRRKVKTFLGINYESIAKDSNQNQFDTEKIKGIGDYYDYRQTCITPSVTFRFLPANSDLSISYDVIRKNYSSRIVQDVNGNYAADEEKIYQSSNVMNLRFAFPVMKKYLASISCSFRNSRSNMLYEKYFQYNFNAYSYMLGVGYEY